MQFSHEKADRQILSALLRTCNDSFLFKTDLVFMHNNAYKLPQGKAYLMNSLPINQNFYLTVLSMLF